MAVDSKTGRFVKKVPEVLPGPTPDTRCTPLSRGQVGIFNKDFPLIYKYCYLPENHRRTGYAARSVHRGKENKTVFMHNDVMEWRLGRKLRPGEEVDHIDGNGLNNAISNLRLVDKSEQAHATPKRRTWCGQPCSSKYKGVFWAKDRSKWRSYITKDGERTWFGSFSLEADAARAYDRKALELYGPYARLNFPSGPQS